ncbi:hypothetical protein M404DRAFT_25742 [Pisolithus tinctorius Marx 270]|uniref:Uncharacterized protein n=1 Tax=Pisolithus tinctorius Marx 270 TaxID=870435 RepID=A0A0C3PBP2_PISTI|nr:hypothetical protein M404DRAFT_25742 [Pisolithus tinctorius Marx 270]
MAHNRNHGKLQAFDDMPMMDSDNSNEEGFVSAAEELDQCIDEDMNVGDTAVTLHTPPVRSLPPFPRPLQMRCPSRAHVPVALPMQESPRNESIAQERESYDSAAPITRRDLLLITENLQSDIANAARAAVSDALKLCFPMAAYPSTDVDESQSPSKQRKKKTLPSHCKSADLEFQRLIREHAQLLMGRENAKSLFTNVPTKEEATAYQSAQGPACTPNAFHVDLNDVPSSAWNKSASHVFTDSFRNAYPDCGRTSKQICTAWVVHFNYLRQIYATQQQVTCAEQARIGRIVAGHATGNNVDDVGILDQQRRTRRRQERKSQLYMRRLRAANTHARAYPTASHVVQELGVAGMSSDESDHEAGWGETTYMITKKMWRANQVTAWLRALDALHLRARYQRQWRASAGAWPHLRLISAKPSERAPVEGLAHNFYAREFLDSLDPHSLSDLDIQDVVELDIPESLTKLTKEYDVFDKQIYFNWLHARHMYVMAEQTLPLSSSQTRVAVDFFNGDNVDQVMIKGSLYLRARPSAWPSLVWYGGNRY